MSTNKMKYFEVSTTTIVKANTKAEAMKAARSPRSAPNAKVQGTWTSGDRISAVEARFILDQTTTV